MEQTKGVKILKGKGVLNLYKDRDKHISFVDNIFNMDIPLQVRRNCNTK